LCSFLNIGTFLSVLFLLLIFGGLTLYLALAYAGLKANRELLC
jgi:hypothetical protein